MTAKGKEDVPGVALDRVTGVIGVDPAYVLNQAGRMATALTRLVQTKKLYQTIQGRRYILVEGWTSLAAMNGVTPHEVSVTEQDGIFVATVELRRMSDGQVIARASAECGSPDEVGRDGKPTWSTRPRYARRSMALTRATAKACRLAFSWIVTLAGMDFSTTPAEEVPPDGFPEQNGPPAGQPGAPAAVPAGPAKAGRKADFTPQSFRGKPLSQLSTDELVKLRDWAVLKSPEKFAAHVEAIDLLLDQRREREPGE